jgi:hypothetical protein
MGELVLVPRFAAILLVVSSIEPEVTKSQRASNRWGSPRDEARRALVYRPDRDRRAGSWAGRASDGATEMNVKSVWCVSVVLVAGTGACTKPPPVCEPGTRYYEAYRSCIPACERVYSYEDCYGRDGEVYTDGAYDGPRADAGDSASGAEGGRDAGADSADGSDSALVCDGGESACAGRCVSTQSDPLNCGACGRACVAEAGARATCAMGACASECLAGFERAGDACEPGVVRPVFPPVTSTVTSRRPTLRWASAMGVTGAQVELCRDRACAMVIERIDATGESARPTADLPANRVVFWRLRARVGAVTATRTSPTWQFRTGVLSPAVDTAHGVEADFNGDGFSDVAVGDVNASAVSVYYGSATGLSATAERVLMGGGGLGATVASGGDVNGDGFADLLIAAPSFMMGARNNAGAVFVHFGGPAGISALASQTIIGPAPGYNFGSALVALGDVNGDGWGDAAVGYVAGLSPVTTQQVVILLGSATGLPSAASQTFEGRVTAGEFTIGVAAAGDTNGDGRADLVLTNLIDSTARVYRGTTTGVSSAAHVTLARTARTVTGAGDVNGDGFSDIVLPSAFGAAVYWGSSGGPAAVESQSIGGAVAPVVGEIAGLGGDFNGDGYADLLLPIEVMGQPRIGLFRGSAAGLSSTSAATMGTVEYAAALRLRGDFNGDGLADAVLASPWQDLTTNASVWFGTVATPSTPTTLGFGRSITP